VSGKSKSRSSGRKQAQTENRKGSRSLVTSAATILKEDAAPYRPTTNPSPGLPATLSPSDGERDGVRGTPRFIDLFCGIGGFRLAFERAGARCVFSSDWDKFSRQTYAANFGETPQGGIHQVAVADIPKFDILCGGFPCQPFSLAGVSKKNSLGRKHGFEDVKQGNLFFSIADILDYHQPPAFVLEKVKHLKPIRESPVPSGSRMSNRNKQVNESDRSHYPAGRKQPCPVGRG